MNNQLYELGYYIGKTEEIVDDFDEFQYYVNLIKNTANNKEQFYSVRQTVHTGDIPEGYEFPFLSSIKDYPERKRLIETLALPVSQQWFELEKTPVKDNGDSVDFRPYFRKLATRLAVRLYPELNEENIYHNDAITLFEDGDFIKPHVDGQNPGRICVLLLYLSDEQDSNNGGGELIISDTGIYEKINPFKGTFTLLDFKTHNLTHSVEMIKNNFRRFTYINFINNREKMEQEGLLTNE